VPANRIQVRSAYNYDADKASEETGISFEGTETLTQQQFKEETDINTIVQRFGLTGELPNGINMPQSGDFTNVSDFHTAMNMVRQAEESFMLLPAATRERFNNDPNAVMAFLSDTNNRDEAIRLGMIEKPAEQTRATVDNNDKT